MEEKQWGGAREGSGRKRSVPEGARQRNILLTDAEFKAVKEFVRKIREKSMS